MTFGGERMMVSATDPVAGTITVLGRSGSSAPLAAGSIGNHTSNGVLYQNDDGSIKRYVTMFTEGTGLIALSPTEALMRVSSGYDLPDPGVCLHVAVDQAFEPMLRPFFYLPFEHHEDAAAQARSVQLFTALGEPQGLEYALLHADLIARFGRFPHRNIVMGRMSTPEEIAYLASGGFAG